MIDSNDIKILTCVMLSFFSNLVTKAIPYVGDFLQILIYILTVIYLTFKIIEKWQSVKAKNREQREKGD